MSVVIVGGNERMIRRYEALCKEYSCSARVFVDPDKGIQNFGTPDLLVLFTSTMSHKMLNLATGQAKKTRYSNGSQPYKLDVSTQKYIGQPGR